MPTSRNKPKAPAHIAARLRSLQQRMRRWGLRGGRGALLVTNPVDVRYLTGFVGDDSWALVRAAGATVYVLSDFRFRQQIREEAPQVRAVMRRTTLAAALAELRQELGIARVAVQRGHLTLGQQRALAKQVGARRLRAVDDGLLAQRAVKQPVEIEHLRQALRIQQQAFRRLLDYVRPGQTETEAAAYLEYQMRLLGAQGAAFPTIAAADSRAALPHAIPGTAKLKSGGILLVDWGARYRGYCGDLTRVVAFGGMKPKMREIYRIVLDAQLAAIDAIAPGRRLRDVDAVARRLIEKAGYGECFGHGLGHGVGLNVHEQPVLSSRSSGELEPGHVVTVEPGIYLPGVGGVRIEDDVLVTARGHEVLSELPKTLESAII